MKLAAERSIVAGLIVVLLLMAGIGLASYFSINRLVENTNRTSDSLNLRRRARGVLVTMLNLETGTRGFVITGEDRYLEPYRNAVNGLSQQLTELSQAMGTAPDQQRQFKELAAVIDVELAIEERHVNLRRKRGFEAASRDLKSGDGLREMDQIRNVIGSIVAEQDELMTRQSLQAIGRARQTIWTIGIGGASGFIFVCGLCGMIHRDLRRRRKATEQLEQSEERFRQLVEGAKGYAILMLDTQGRIQTWNAGAQRISGYERQEIIGQHFSRFFNPEELESGKPQRELETAIREGQYEEEGWRVRKDGSQYWSNVLLTRLMDSQGKHIGFSKIARDLTERKFGEDQIAGLNKTLLGHNQQLASINSELEAFSYSVSHDLRAPLRSLDGFSQALLEDCSDKLDPEDQDNLRRIRGASQRMGRLIDDLLNLSRLTRVKMNRETVDLSKMARETLEELRVADPQRDVEFVIADELIVEADSRLLQIAVTNLMGNAWKFTSNRAHSRIELGCTGNGGDKAFFVRDNGVGFDMAYASKLFGAFERLHAKEEFPGTGIGLATVQRIIHRHGGRIWAESALDNGATFHFKL